jgi:excisionase family DNA binding protein
MPLTRLLDRPDFLARLGAALDMQGDGAVGVVVVQVSGDADESARGALGDGVAARAGVQVATRLGPRTLAVLQPSGGERQALACARRLLDAVPDPGSVAGVAVAVGAAVDPAQLVDDARMAAEQASMAGPGAVEIFDPGMRRRLAERLALREDLRRAVEADELRLAYQPIVSLVDGRVVAAEALLRWTHPVRGAVPAGEFLPLAAQEGLVEQIGRWVLREAAAQLARWDADDEIDLGYLAINVFGEQLRETSLARELQGVLEAAGVHPGRIALEITEQAISDSPVAVATIEQLHALGVRLLLDDFGTGASSLRSLRRLPLDGVKIDGSFVAGISDDVQDRHIAAAIVGMARALGMDVIAESVETADQAQWLRRLGCAVAQGFVFARPALPEDIRPVLVAGLAGGTPGAALGPVEEPARGNPAERSWVRGEDQLITLGEAAQLLGTSASTARRWADSGQLRVVRTAGGHRRFARADVERLAGGAAALPVVRRWAAFPPASAAVARVLADGGGEMTTAAGRAVYEDGASGWLGGEYARAALDRFALQMAAAVRIGDEPGAAAAVRRLSDDAREAGAALVEVDAFLGRYFALVTRALRRKSADDADISVPRVLAMTARQVLLRHVDGR